MSATDKARQMAMLFHLKPINNAMEEDDTYIVLQTLRMMHLMLHPQTADKETLRDALKEVIAIGDLYVAAWREMAELDPSYDLRVTELYMEIEGTRPQFDIDVTRFTHDSQEEEE